MSEENEKAIRSRRWKLGILGVIHVDFAFIYTTQMGLDITWFNSFCATIFGIVFFIGGYLTATHIWGGMKK
jgi:hypothetical protein